MSSKYIPYSTKFQLHLDRISKHKNPPDVAEVIIRKLRKQKRLQDNSGMNSHDKKKKTNQ